MDCQSKEDSPGDLSHWPSEPPPAAAPDAELSAAAVASCALEAAIDVPQAESARGDCPQENPADETEASAWRDELTARLGRYRARRKMRPPRYPSLMLQFDAHRSFESRNLESRNLESRRLVSENDEMRSVEPVYEVASDRALALDLSTPGSTTEIEPGLPPTSRESGSETEHSVQPSLIQPSLPARAQIRPSAKIIEFPKYGWEPSFEPPAAPSPDQLAGPVMDRPRILEVPEYEAPAPALGGITIEPVERPDAEKRLGIDIPLQSASLARRIFASLIDGVIIVIAVAVFGGIFWKVAAVRPPLVQMIGMGAAALFTFWAVYQYLLLVYAGSTPGLLAAGLELARFNGSPTNRSMRRWRVLASYLSAVSLGLGYVWVFLDEDVLCWHDRITHTYLAPEKRAEK
jgi:uncharacterized RDD family membrane protein YckC